MRYTPRIQSFAFTLALSVSAIVMSGCATHMVGKASSPSVGQPAEFSGKVVGPIEFGQPTEGAGLRAYGLALDKPLLLDDKADCGPQTTEVMAIESEAVAGKVGQSVVLRATPYCRVDRSGKYHLKDVTIR